MNKNVEQWVCESMLTIIDWTWLNNHAAFRFTKTVHIMVTSWLNHEIWRLEQNWEVWLETHSQHHKALPSTPVFFFSVPGHVSPFLYCSNDRGMVFERTASTSHVCVCRVLEPMTGKILPLAQETVPKYVAFLSHRGTPVVIHFSGIFPWNKPSSYWGTRMTMETPIGGRWWTCLRVCSIVGFLFFFVFWCLWWLLLGFKGSSWFFLVSRIHHGFLLR